MSSIRSHTFSTGQYSLYFFPFICSIFLVVFFALILFVSMLCLLLFSCIRSRDFILTRESNSLSDYWRVRRLSIELRLFLVYCPHGTTLSFKLQFPSFIISFLWIPWVVHSLASVFSPTLLSGSSGIAVSSCSVLAVYPRFLISVCGVFSFFVSYAYFVLRTLFSLRASYFYSYRVSTWICFPSLLLFPLGF